MTEEMDITGIFTGHIKVIAGWENCQYFISVNYRNNEYDPHIIFMQNKHSECLSTFSPRQWNGYSTNLNQSFMTSFKKRVLISGVTLYCSWNTQHEAGIYQSITRHHAHTVTNSSQFGALANPSSSMSLGGERKLIWTQKTCTETVPDKQFKIKLCTRTIFLSLY